MGPMVSGGGATAGEGPAGPSRPVAGDPGPWGRLVQDLFVATGEAVARWTRLDYDGPGQLPDPPALIVANHGFGGIFDLNALVLAALADRLHPGGDRSVTILTHQFAWTLGVGPLLEPAGFRPAGGDAAMEALAAGDYVIVLPGGDLDAAKSFAHRNEIVFGGRTGFARIARDAQVPIIPVVISGAGETALVLHDGQRLARALGLTRLARLKTLPISVSIPYGLSIGVAGMLPYLPAPAKMRAAVLEPMTADAGEAREAFAARVETAMSDALTALTAGRIPFLGFAWDDLPGRAPVDRGPRKS